MRLRSFLFEVASTPPVPGGEFACPANSFTPSKPRVSTNDPAVGDPESHVRSGPEQPGPYRPDSVTEFHGRGSVNFRRSGALLHRFVARSARCNFFPFRRF